MRLFKNVFYKSNPQQLFFWKCKGKKQKPSTDILSCMPFLLVCTMIISLPQSAVSQDFSQTIEQKAIFKDPGNAENTLKVFNISGSVTITGYEGNEIQLSAIQEIEGTEREIELAKEELSLRVEQEDDLVLVYLEAPFIKLRREDGRISYRMNRWDEDYKFLFDINIRVPKNTHVHASTINRGVVRVENMLKTVKASNVNGEVQLNKIAGSTEAHTVNGDITASYIQSPEEDSEFQTINGTIEVNYPPDLSADIRFKSMHGDLYTDFSNTTRLKTEVKKHSSSRNGKTTFRLDRFSPLRIGNGGPVFSFEVLNGDVYVKQIKS